MKNKIKELPGRIQQATVAAFKTKDATDEIPRAVAVLLIMNLPGFEVMGWAITRRPDNTIGVLLPRSWQKKTTLKFTAVP